MNTVKPSKASALASVRALIAGTQKHTPNGSLTFGNATYAAASLVQMFQSLADAMTAHDAAVANTKDVLLALRDVVAKVGPVLRAYRRFLVATYGSATETLADYGLKPPKRKRRGPPSRRRRRLRSFVQPARRGEPRARSRRLRSMGWSRRRRQRLRHRPPRRSPRPEPGAVPC